MKRLRRIFSIVLVLILTVSILTMPASASLGTQFETAISNFPTRSTAYSNTFDGYTCVIQRFLWGYSDTAKELFAKTDGADGYYGERTKYAVEIFQSKCGIDSDGITGKDTWTEIASGLSGRTVKPYTYVTCNDCEVIKIMASYADTDLNYIYYYYTGGETAKVGYVFYTE